jgi:hypothetical protein
MTADAPLTRESFRRLHPISTPRPVSETPRSSGQRPNRVVLNRKLRGVSPCPIALHHHDVVAFHRGRQRGIKVAHQEVFGACSASEGLTALV